MQTGQERVPVLPPHSNLYNVLINPASRAARSGSERITIFSRGLCAFSPTAPSPSRVGTPIAAVKFPSDPPPTKASPRVTPISFASARAFAYSAALIFGSLGGRGYTPG